MGSNPSEVRRQSNRIFVTLPITMRAGSNGRAILDAQTVDFSDRGLRVRTNRPILTKEKVEVHLSNNDPQPKRYRVMWVRNPAKEQPHFEAGLKIHT